MSDLLTASTQERTKTAEALVADDYFPDVSWTGVNASAQISAMKPSEDGDNSTVVPHISPTVQQNHYSVTNQTTENHPAKNRWNTTVWSFFERDRLLNSSAESNEAEESAFDLFSLFFSRKIFSFPLQCWSQLVESMMLSILATLIDAVESLNGVEVAPRSDLVDNAEFTTKGIFSSLRESIVSAAAASIRLSSDSQLALSICCASASMASRFVDPTQNWSTDTQRFVGRELKPFLPTEVKDKNDLPSCSESMFCCRMYESDNSANYSYRSFFTDVVSPIASSTVASITPTIVADSFAWIWESISNFGTTVEQFVCSPISALTSQDIGGLTSLQHFLCSSRSSADLPLNNTVRMDVSLLFTVMLVATVLILWLATFLSYWYHRDLMRTIDKLEEFAADQRKDILRQRRIRKDQSMGVHHSHGNTSATNSGQYSRQRLLDMSSSPSTGAVQ